MVLVYGMDSPRRPWNPLLQFHSFKLFYSFEVIALSPGSENLITYSFGTYRNGTMSDILERQTK